MCETSQLPCRRIVLSANGHPLSSLRYSLGGRNALCEQTDTVSINDTVVRTLSYTVPPEVQQHLSFIYPTSQ